MEREQKRRDKRGPAEVRESDVEPYTALRWVGTLFKAAAVFLGVAIVAEFIAGLRFEGTAALPVLLGEMARTAVIAVVLWGGGDLVRLLIDVGHDLRAERVLLGRIAARIPRAAAGGDGARPGRETVRPAEAERPMRAASGGQGEDASAERAGRSTAPERQRPDAAA